MRYQHPKKLVIPVQLIQEVFKLGIIKEFKVLVGAKMLTPGILRWGSSEVIQLSMLVGLKQRTLKKHLDRLVTINWVGYNASTKTYYLRSWTWLRDSGQFFKRASVPICLKDIASFQAFLAGSLIGLSILNMKYACDMYVRNNGNKMDKLEYKQRKRSRKQVESVINDGGMTSQGSTASSPLRNKIPIYFGMSNAGIAKLLCCSYTNACDLKNAAERAGYIKTKPHFSKVIELNEPNFGIRHWCQMSLSEERARRLRHITVKKKGVKQLMLVEQLHDEIHPLLDYHRINYLQKIKQKRKKKSPAVLSGFSPS